MTSKKTTDNEAFVKRVQSRLGVTPDGWAGRDTVRAWEAKHEPVIPTAPDVVWHLLDDRSEERLRGVDPLLANVVRRAAKLSTVPFLVIEGLRSKERQAELYAQGRTKPGGKVTWTMKSKHIEGKAVDLAPYENGKIDWNTLSKFDAIYRAMMAAAAELGASLRYGGDWDSDGVLREKGETDSPHFELR